MTLLVSFLFFGKIFEIHSIKQDILIKYLIVKHLGVCNSCFYIGNSNTIKVIDINFTLADGGETVLDPTPE